MHTDYMPSFPVLLAEAADLLANLPLTDLPPLASIKAGYDLTTGTFEIDAQIWSAGDELRQIDAIRMWALALGGVTLLGEENRHQNSAYRRMEAVKALEVGTTLTVWTHIAKQNAPAPLDPATV